jgi:hypothetical protein
VRREGGSGGGVDDGELTTRIELPATVVYPDTRTDLSVSDPDL